MSEEMNGRTKPPINDRDKVNTEKKKGGCFKSFILWFLFFVIGLLLIAVYLGLNHQFFNIKYINIRGNSKIEDEEIISYLEFEKGDNIFKASTDDSEKKVSKLEGIEKVSISKVIPNKINIRVTELFDIGYIKDGSDLFIIDKNGFIKSNKASDEDLNDLIEFTSINNDNLRIGMNIAEDTNFKNLINAIRNKNFFSKITSIDLGDLDESIMKFNTGLIVKFDNEDISDEMETLEKLFQMIHTQDIRATEIILNIGEHPIVVQEDD